MSIKLWVDDIRTEPEGWQRARSVTEAIRILDTMEVSEVSIDHDISMKVSVGHGDPRPFASPETFEPVARFIAAKYVPGIVITLHTASSIGAEKMAGILRDAGHNPAIRLSKPCNRFEFEGGA